MDLINYLNTHENWVEELSTSPYNITIKEKNGYYLLKYRQFESDFDIPMVGEARGCIVYYSDYMEKWVYGCRPFTRFYNEGEPNAAELDWFRVQFTEKIDGTLIKVWSVRENGEVVQHVSTMNNIDAKDAPLNSIKYPTFYDLFCEASKGIEIPNTIGYTYLFELVSPENRVVIPYEKTELYYLTTIDNYSGEEMEDCPYGCKRPKVYNLSHEEIEKLREDSNWNVEGWVAYDGKNRLKLKTQKYFLAHYARDNNTITWDRLIRVIRAGEQDEFLAYAGDYADELDMVESKLEDMRHSAAVYTHRLEMECKKPRKEYAEYVKTIPKAFQAWAFKFYESRMQWLEFEAGLKDEKLEEVLFNETYLFKE